MAKIHYAMHRLNLALAREDDAGIAGVAELAAAFAIIPPMSNPFTGWLAVVSGRLDEGRRRIEAAIQIPEAFPSIIVAAEATLALRDRELAARIYPFVRGFCETQIGFWSSHGSMFIGPTARIAAKLAAFLGKNDEARALFEESIRICERMQALPYLELSKKGLAALGDAPCAPTSARPSAIAMEREGDVWRITTDGRTIRVKDTKGLAYLADLVARPGQDLHVTQLAELPDTVSGDAGPVLDAKAKAAYKERVEALRERIAEANRFGDYSGAEKAQDEVDAIADQIAAAVGIGGRDRKVGSHVERARINVQRRLKDAIQRIAEHDTALGKYLSAAVKTGTWCSFTPF
jgi:hypothetical protein